MSDLEGQRSGSLQVGWLAAWTAAGFLIIWLYAPLTYSMALNWLNDPNYSHGFLVPLVSAWVVWRQREALSRLPARANPWGLLVIALGLLILVVGQFGYEFFLRRLSIIPVLWGLVLLVWGWPVARRLIFAFAYLLLMVPWPYVLYDSLAFPLRFIAAQFAGWGLRWLGIPVFVEGNILHLPHVVLDVVDACSGIRSLVSLLAVAIILAYVALPRIWARVLLVLLVLPVAVAANALRVVITGILAEGFGSHLVEGMTHDFTGWAVFMVAFVVLAGLTWILNRVCRGAGSEG